ncbi:VCP-like ATPase [Candidatus Lokiarchaeum ossiferum]|uniref:VCP-like ATPase n=1 Tax=Candidatus Lokiarchaeum ossiferum TaxID=2951803 RepID=A0ABY6HW16_9ARCH|nr:VCP-like ATPase [Candidatus Lokiarchaeum sp. B-35]
MSMDGEPSKNPNGFRRIKLKVQEARKRDVGRSIIRLDSATMKDLDVNTGDIIEIQGKEQSTAAIAWPAYPQDQGLGIIRIDSRVRKNANIGIDEFVNILKVEEAIAKSVVLAPISLKIKPNTRFESFVKRKLLNFPITKGDLIYINIGMTKEIVFRITSIKPAGISLVKQSTILSINESTVDEIPQGIAYITYEDIGGLDREIQLVREMVELPLKHPELFKRLGIDPPKGVLLRGPPGCGKTLLAKAVANESQAHFISINGPEIMSKFYGESEKKLRGLFKEAEEKNPSIIFIDEIDAIAPKRENVTGEVERRVVAQLLALMDGLESRGRVVIIGATNRPNAVDPALRRPGRFDRELEIKVPGENGRLEILQIHTRKMPLDEDVKLQEVARVSHGYVGADIASLVRETGMCALRRYLPEINLEDEEVDPDILDHMFVEKDDFDKAFKEIIPSGIREVFIEIPSVHWSNVGGLEYTKQQLIESVEWPIKNPGAYLRMGVAPPTGVLLYGPPGCGKTLLARAVATESEANFISIKGPELLSKWVGESEKAVREVFRKAKLAAPCIIFFDELDSIAPRRGSGGTDSGVTERVISQLLTELDGLAQAKEIILIAATNRPDILDPALMRPGRIDRLAYVPPPGPEDREAIFEIFTEGMPLDDDVKLHELSLKTDFFTGADIESLCREAAIRALRENIRGETIHNIHFEMALEEMHPSASQEVCESYEKFEDALRSRKIGSAGARKGRDLYT